MRGFGRLLYSEIKRLRHTSLLYLHIAVPAAGTAAFLWYYSLAGWESRSEVLVYFQTVACVWPFFCGMVCGLSAEMEEALGYQNFFLLPGRRFHALLAKWIVLLGLGLLAGLAALMGFSLVYRCFPDGNAYGLWTCLSSAALIFLGQVTVYLIHLALSFAAGKGVSICFGIAGTLLSFLFLTGLGDGKWMFFPWAWGGRFSTYLLLYMAEKDRGLKLSETIWKEAGVCFAIAICIILLAFVWFYKYEGRRSQEE
ncbi:lantibiotic immunity ABC transporter MutG family permease subunit [Merdimonas faecis]|uniref:lantibiotic immunity ABC transporter MutG family permease subunit n=1 Tax=Merdimonas faecis TaxID=1653435 RepID=UPI0023F9A89D|nr:lantibiotic immunity ABC transporter MutG family permease subunit [Merdimonas faecis]